MDGMQTQSTLFRRREGPQGGDSGVPFGSPSSSSSPSLPPRNTGAAPSVTVAQERENDALMEALLADMRRAKKGFTKVGDEVRAQNALLETLRSTFMNAQSSLRATTRNLDKIGWGSFKHMWVLALFVLIFFVLLYLMLRFR